MSMVRIEKGKHLIHKDDAQEKLEIILQGRVNMIVGDEVIPLDTGTIIGIAACEKQRYCCDYIAAEDTVLMEYPYKQVADLEKLFAEQPKYATVFPMAAVKQANTVLNYYGKRTELAKKLYSMGVGMYRDYKYLCSKYDLTEKQLMSMEHLVPLEQSYILEEWKQGYFQALAGKDMQSVNAFLGTDFAVGIGTMLYAGKVINEVLAKMEGVRDYLHYWQDILLEEGSDDLFQLYFDLEIRATRKGADTSDIQQRMEKLMEFIHGSELYDEKFVRERFIEYEGYDFTAIPEEEIETETEAEENAAEAAQAELGISPEAVSDPLAYILEYASYDAEKIEEIRKQIATYRDLPDIYSTDDHVRKLRRSIAAVYYEVYKAAIKRALQEQAISPILRMFFDFGFMDSGLLGEEYTEQLYAVAERLSECNSEHVYTMYEWLKSIYIGKNEPSKNEFDLDYPAYLADLRRNGTITKKEQEEWKDDQWKKVEYEIENMFTSSNRAVYGKISTFIPILCEYDIVNSVETMLVTAARINEALDKIRSVDFSIFYRDTTFSDPAHDITREFLKKEVLPDVILMPNAGTKAMMWQETAGGRRDTSARFLFPVMTAGNLDELMLETAGRFRWEMCRKEQGARWNDIREMSLTSEYYDYVQYYKKNHDLSPEAKEKLKNALWKAKNNYREVFVKDYQVWIKYEAKGSFRMNRVARGILFRYCPFVKEIRDSLKVSPMYQEMIQKYDIIIGREKRHVALFEDKYRKAGGELTEEMIVNKEFYEM